MALVKALKDSNAAMGGADHTEDKADAAMAGYSVVAEEGEPASSPSEVASTGKSIGDLGNDGTNLGSYSFQSGTLDGKTGNIGK